MTYYSTPDPVALTAIVVTTLPTFSLAVFVLHHISHILLSYFSSLLKRGLQGVRDDLDRVHDTVSQCVDDDLVAVNLGDVVDQVQNTAGVTPLVVVPGDQLDKVVVQGDTSLGVEDGGSGVAVHVGGDNVVLSVGQDACCKIC